MRPLEKGGLAEGKSLDFSSPGLWISFLRIWIFLPLALEIIQRIVKVNTSPHAAGDSCGKGLESP
jgi:hypothetical protein